jgi:hypothetical protein
VAEGNPLEASEESPVVVWAENGLVSSALSKAVEAHTIPDPHVDLRAIMAKLEAGADLNKDETKLVLRTLLARVVI